MDARWFGLWIGLGLWPSSGVGAAQTTPGRVSLRWSAPDECPDDIHVVHEVEGLLGQSLLESSEQSLGVRVVVQGSSALGYSAKISFSGPRGNDERALEHPDCEKLAQASALIVALAIDPERVRATQRARYIPGEAPVASPPAATAEARAAVMPSPVAVRPAPGCDVAPASPELREPARNIRFAVHGVAGAGPLPNFGAGLEAAIGWHHRNLEADLLGRYWVPRSSELNVLPSASLDVALSTLGVRGCFQPLAGVWSFSACLGGDVGDLRASGRGVENPRTAQTLYAAAAGAVRVSYARYRLEPEGGFELSGALARPRFGVTENGQSTETFRPGAWGFNVFGGFAFEL